MKLPESCDVLVVGAGPTGLMLANQLLRHGIQPTIIDRHPGPSVQTKALGVQARTMEIYAHLGIADSAIELGKRAIGAQMWVNGRRAARVPLGDIGRDLSPYPYLLILGQDDNERLLGDLLRKQGVDVNWSTELVGLTQNPQGVIATLKQPDGTTREVRARWVAGCDGAHSAVRNLNGIGFLGAPYEHVFYVADTTVTGSMAPGELNVALWLDGFHLFFPMRDDDHWRLVGLLPPELRTRDNVEFDEVKSAIREQTGMTLDFKECRWFSKYRIHHRHAERFHDRRCFLLGDAAHIHSPVGAQGMNTGLQDAYNLGWKLALAATGRAADSLLDSYEAERLPVARQLLGTTDRGFTAIVSDSLFNRILRTRVLARILAFAMRFERAQKLAFRTISQIGIQYRASRLSQTLAALPGRAPQAGDRFPWLRLRFAPNAPAQDLFARFDDRRFNLIVVAQSARTVESSALGGFLLIHEVPADPVNDRELAKAGISGSSYYLLRPDCYIGLVGSMLDPEKLMRYLTKRVGLRYPPFDSIR